MKGNQLYAKETKIHLDQRKMDIREDNYLKIDANKLKLNQGSGKVIVTNDVKGNQQLYAKATKMCLDQRKMDTREEKNLKIDVRELQELQAKELTNRRQYEEEMARLELRMQEIEGEQIDVNKEKLNQGSGKVDIKEMKVYLDQKKKMDVREDYKEVDDYYKHRVNIFWKY